MVEQIHASRDEILSPTLLRYSAETQFQSELAALNAINWALSQSLDLDRVLELALESTLRVLGSHVGCIHTPVDTELDELRLRVHVGLPPEFAQSIEVLPHDDPEVQRTIASGGAVVSDRGETLLGQITGDDLGVGQSTSEAWVCFPVVARNRFQGLMSILIDEFAPDYARLLKTIGQHVGVAIDNAKLYRRVQQDAHQLGREAERWHALNQAAVAVGSARSEQDVYDTITHALSKLGFSVVILAVDPSPQDLTVVSAATQLPRLLRAVERLTGQSLSEYPIPPGHLDFCRRVMEQGQAEIFELGAEYFAQLLPEPVAHLAPRIVRRAGLDYGIAAPLQANEQTVGVLVVAGSDLVPEDVPSITAFADQASAAIENVRLIQAERRQREVAEMLTDLVVTVNSTLDVDQVLDIAVHRLQELHRATACSVSFLEEDGETFVFQATTDPGLDVTQRITFPASKSIAGRAIRDRKVQAVGDLDRSPDYRAEFARRTGIIDRSLLTAPLFTDDKPLGVIQVLSATPDAFSQADAELLTTTAALIETAIARAQAFSRAVHLAQSESHQREVAETLRGVAILINASLDLDTVLDRILEQLAQVVDYDSTSLMLVEGDKLTMHALRGFQEFIQVLEIVTGIEDNPLFQEMAVSRRPILICDVKADARYRRWAGSAPVRSWIGVPLMVRDRVIGQLAVDKHEPNFYDEDDAELVLAFAQQAAIAIENAKLFEAEQSQRQMAEALRQAVAAISSTLDYEEVIDRILEQVSQVVPNDATRIMLVEDGVARVLRWRGFDNFGSEDDIDLVALEIAKTPNLQTMQETGQPFTVASIQEYGAWVPMPQTSWIKSTAAAPIHVRDRLIGFLHVDSVTANRFSQDDAELLLAFAQQAAIAIENAQLHQALQNHATELEARVEVRTAEVNREHERLLAVLESAGEAIAIADADGLIEYANPAWEKLIGYDVSQAIRHKTRILDDEAFSDLLAAAHDTVLPQRIWRRELAGYRPDGAAYFVDLTVTPVFDGAGELANLVAIYRDITQYKEVDRIKSEFLSTAAHELRSPLTSILGFSELLLHREELSDEEEARFLKYIHEHTVHLKQLVSDLLDISRIESGTSFSVELEPSTLSLLFEKEIRSWQEAHPDHTFRLHTEHNWPQVYADKDRIRQVIRNLLSNATKYSPSGGTVAVSAAPVGGFLEVTVADEGVGMTGDELAHIFEKFWRADASSTAVEGTGLGLVIVKHILEQHGGYIWVESIKDAGTAVHFTLPLVERRITVLIAEDEDGVREIEHRILSNNGIATLLCSNGRQAVEMAETHHPDLILLDLKMPDMQGQDVLHALKSNPATQHIPVVVVSARSSWQTIEESYMLGAVDFLTKPFEYQELLSRVRRALRIAGGSQQQTMSSS